MRQSEAGRLMHVRSVPGIAFRHGGTIRERGDVRTSVGGLHVLAMGSHLTDDT